MKNSVGLAKITFNRNSQQSLKVYLAKKLADVIGHEIVFNWKDMVIKRPTLDNIHVHSIKGHTFSFMPVGSDFENFVGDYKVFQLDEDTFILKKRKNA